MPNNDSEFEKNDGKDLMNTMSDNLKIMVLENSAEIEQKYSRRRIEKTSKRVSTFLKQRHKFKAKIKILIKMN